MPPNCGSKSSNCEPSFCTPTMSMAAALGEGSQLLLTTLQKISSGIESLLSGRDTERQRTADAVVAALEKRKSLLIEEKAEAAKVEAADRLTRDFQACQTIGDLCKSAGYQWSPEENLAFCVCCIKYKKYGLVNGKPIPASLVHGQNYARFGEVSTVHDGTSASLNARMRSMRQNMRGHRLSKGHAWCEEQIEALRRRALVTQSSAL